jgi:hypothetical protein
MILALEMCLWSGGEYLYNVYQQFKAAKGSAKDETEKDDAASSAESDDSERVSAEHTAQSGVDDMLSTLTNETKRSDEAHAADQVVTGTPFGTDTSAAEPASDKPSPSDSDTPFDFGKRND